jgi:hypothetical protein
MTRGMQCRRLVRATKMALQLAKKVPEADFVVPALRVIPSLPGIGFRAGLRPVHL